MSTGVTTLLRDSTDTMTTILPRGTFAYLRHRCSEGLGAMRAPRGFTQSCLPSYSYKIRGLSTHDASAKLPDDSISEITENKLGPVYYPTSQVASRNAAQSKPFAHPADVLLSSLPVSPLVDDSFVKARSRWSQPKPKRAPFKPNSFRRKIAINPFAQILATPDRFCPVTKVHIPRGCLQSFRLVAHPSTGAPWWVPPDLLPTAPQIPPSGPDGKAQPPAPTSLDRGPTSYTLPRIDLLRAFTSPSGKYRNGHKTFLRSSSKTGLQGLLNSAIWREDMDVHILGLMRLCIYKELVYLAGMCESDNRRYLVSLTDPAELSKLYQKGCVLHLPDGVGPETPGQEWSQLDVPVYSLQLLLGSVLSARLRSELSVFQAAPMTLLRGIRTLDLQKQLWKLYGYNV